MSIGKLIDISSGAVGFPVGINDAALGDLGNMPEELVEILLQKNGFYAFESALHVFPLATSCSGINDFSLQQWNASGLWRNYYGNLISGLVFFAEDVFGGQFGFKGREIVYFDPESGELSVVGDSVEAWVEILLSDYKNITGYPLAHAWQSINGSIPIGKRLLPKIPFILGGEYSVGNLFAVDSIKGMQYRGELWTQICNLPDGAKVQLKVLPV